jgi:hypothetical protein
MGVDEGFTENSAGLQYSGDRSDYDDTMLSTRSMSCDLRNSNSPAYMSQPTLGSIMLLLVYELKTMVITYI